MFWENVQEISNDNKLKARSELLGVFWLFGCFCLWLFRRSRCLFALFWSFRHLNRLSIVFEKYLWQKIPRSKEDQNYDSNNKKLDALHLRLRVFFLSIRFGCFFERRLLLSLVWLIFWSLWLLRVLLLFGFWRSAYWLILIIFVLTVNFLEFALLFGNFFRFVIENPVTSMTYQSPCIFIEKLHSLIVVPFLIIIFFILLNFCLFGLL